MFGTKSMNGGIWTVLEVVQLKMVTRICGEWWRGQRVTSFGKIETKWLFHIKFLVTTILCRRFKISLLSGHREDKPEELSTGVIRNWTLRNCIYILSYRWGYKNSWLVVFFFFIPTVVGSKYYSHCGEVNNSDNMVEAFTNLTLFFIMV